MKKITVIGSGVAGSLLCNQLVTQHEVTLLEKGAEDSIRFPELHFLEKKFAEVHTCCYGGGGTTNLWHNGLIPINCEDVYDPVFREVLNDAGRFMDKAAAALFFPGVSFAAEHRRLKEEVSALSPVFSLFPYGVDCLVYPKKFRKLTVSSGVRAVYSVDDIDFVFAQGRIKAVKFKAAGQWQSVDTDVVVVAAGTLGTPGLVQKVVAAVGGADDQVGLGFIDHPMSFVGKVRVKKEYADLVKKLSAWDRGAYISRNAVRLKSECGNYTACAFFRPALTKDNQLAIYKYKSSLGASNGLARLKNVFSWKILHPDIIAEIFAHFTGVNLPSRTYNILFIAEQRRGVNRVWEQGGAIQVKWKVSEDELVVYRSMLAELRNALTNLAEDINIVTDITGDWLWSAAHHSGTISLGAGAHDLVDGNLRLRCCDNVYICDGSVIQEHSYANTGLAIGQLAMRLAEKIKHGD